ncbi:MAG: metallopeptidase family protein [Promicromonosporaceae bacterium]|nr:metallopeptidase family protein [Promicromonosporaceae bacterium]
MAKNRYRDRRGRGIRGPLIPVTVPGHLTRTEQFDEYVLDARGRLEMLGVNLEGIEFAVEGVPVVTEPSLGVPLGRFIPATSSDPARLVAYRRPIEARAVDQDDLRNLVFDVVVEQIAHHLGRRPEEIDPEYGGNY